MHWIKIGVTFLVLYRSMPCLTVMLSANTDLHPSYFLDHFLFNIKLTHIKFLHTFQTLDLQFMKILLLMSNENVFVIFNQYIFKWECDFVILFIYIFDWDAYQQLLSLEYMDLTSIFQIKIFYLGIVGQGLT